MKASIFIHFDSITLFLDPELACFLQNFNTKGKPNGFPRRRRVYFYAFRNRAASKAQGSRYPARKTIRQLLYKINKVKERLTVFETVEEMYNSPDNSRLKLCKNTHRLVPNQRTDVVKS